MTFSIEIHGWRGFQTNTDLFYKWVRLGFLSVAFSKGSAIDNLLRIAGRLSKPSADGIASVPHEGSVR